MVGQTPLGEPLSSPRWWSYPWSLSTDGHGALYDALAHGGLDPARTRRPLAGLALPGASDERILLTVTRPDPSFHAELNTTAIDKPITGTVRETSHRWGAVMDQLPAMAAILVSPQGRAVLTAGQPGKIVRLFRVERSWTQQELADRAGWSQSTISRIEEGKTRAAHDIDVLAALGGREPTGSSGTGDQFKEVVAATGELVRDDRDESAARAIPAQASSETPATNGSTMTAVVMSSREPPSWFSRSSASPARPAGRGDSAGRVRPRRPRARR